MEATHIEQSKLEQLCRENDVTFLGLFGSVARGEASSESDIDLVVRFSKRKSLLDLVRIEREIAEAFGREVDLVTEASLSPYLRARVLDDVQTVYDEDA